MTFVYCNSRKKQKKPSELDRILFLKERERFLTEQ
jgi:hypothetical protein